MSHRCPNQSPRCQPRRQEVCAPAELWIRSITGSPSDAGMGQVPSKPPAESTQTKQGLHQRVGPRSLANCAVLVTTRTCAHLWPKPEDDLHWGLPLPTSAAAPSSCRNAQKQQCRTARKRGNYDTRRVERRKWHGGAIQPVPEGCSVPCVQD